MQNRSAFSAVYSEPTISRNSEQKSTGKSMKQQQNKYTTTSSYVSPARTFQGRNMHPDTIDNPSPGNRSMRNPPPLSWRLDPDESLSDFVLNVISKEDLNHHDPSLSSLSSSISSLTTKDTKLSTASPEIHTYFVHKSILAVGPRRSEYFASLFVPSFDSNGNVIKKYNNTTPSGSSTTPILKNSIKIELKPSAARCFPAVLDYMYSPAGTPPYLTTNTVVAIRHLATCFGIRDLFNDTNSFIKKDLNYETAAVYLTNAKEYCNTKLEVIAMEVCAKNFMRMKLTALASIPVECVIEIIRHLHFCWEDSEAFSSKMAHYCRCWKDELTLSSLVAITDPSTMPRIAEEDSIFYLHLLSFLGSDFGNDEQKNDVHTKSLYDRCFKVAPRLMKETFQQVQDEELSGREKKRSQLTISAYNSLPEKAKIQILEKSFQVDDNNNDDSRNDVNASLSSRQGRYHGTKYEDDLILDVKRAHTYAAHLEEEVNLMKEEYNKKLRFYEAKLSTKEREIHKYAGRHSRIDEEDAIKSEWQ